MSRVCGRAAAHRFVRFIFKTLPWRLAFFAKELRHAAKPRFPKQRLIAQLMRLPEDLCSTPNLGTATIAQILHAMEALFSEPFVLRQVARLTLGGCVQSICGVMAMTSDSIPCSERGTRISPCLQVKHGVCKKRRRAACWEVLA